MTNNTDITLSKEARNKIDEAIERLTPLIGLYAILVLFKALDNTNVGKEEKNSDYN